MRQLWPLTLALLIATAATTDAQQPPALPPQAFTLQQILSAPYATQLTASPRSTSSGQANGNLFAWVEDVEGRHNLYVGGNDAPARALTHNTEDDAQDITQLAWSPDGSAIAYTYGASNGADGKPANPAHLQRATPLTVIVQPVAPGARPIVLGEGRAPLFERDGSSVLFVRGGQIFLASLTTTSSPKQLVFDRGSASSLTLSPDGNMLAFLSRRSEAHEPSHTLLALFDMKTKALSFPAPSTGDDLSPAWSPDGKEIAWLRAPFTDTPEFALDRTSANPWSIELYDFASGNTHTVFTAEANKPGSVLPHMATGAPPLFFVNEYKLIFASEADGWVHLYSIDPLDTKPAKRITTGPRAFEVEGAVLSPDHKLIVYSSNDASADRHMGMQSEDGLALPHNADLRHLWKVDLATAGSFPQAITTGEGIETQPAILSDGTLAALASGAMGPMQPALVKPGSVEPLAGSAPKLALVLPQQVFFESTDNNRLHGQLFLPEQKADPSAALRNDNRKGDGEKGGENKRPAILFFHGGPRRQMLLGYPAMDYYSNAYAMNQYLASRGFIVLSVNYRCGIGYGLDFRQCEHEGAAGGKEYDDVLAAQKYLASRPDVDVKRIGVWGGSYGGYLTALALARNSDLFAAGVDFHGVHDWNLEDNAGDWKRGSNAEQDAIGVKALASSPMADLSQWRSPVLLIHGDNDPEVAYAQTPLLAEALRARNTKLPKAQQVEVDELIFPDEVHGFLLHRDWLAAYTAAAAFFERVLKP